MSLGAPVIAGAIVPFAPILASPDVTATPGVLEVAVPGVYEVEFDLTFTTPAGSNGFIFNIVQNGAIVVATSSVGGSVATPFAQHVSGVALVALAAGDTVSVVNNLANGDISAVFGQFVIHRVADLP